MLDWQGKVVAITGASSGIGAALAVQLAGRGVRLALAARRMELLRDVAAQVQVQGAQTPVLVRCDVTDWEQVAGFALRTREAAGVADVVVANAGRGDFGCFESQDPEIARAVVDTNLLGVVYTVRAFLPQMLDRGSGRLVLVSSVLGQLPAPRHAVYGATKFAVSGLAESLEYELQDRGVGVTLVEPGLVRTGFAEISHTPPERFHQMPSQSADQVAARIIRAVERERRHLIADPASRWVIALRRHVPKIARVVFRAAFRRLYRGR